MKSILIFVCAVVFLSNKPTVQTCKIVQRHYYKGVLVNEKEYQSIIKDYGCVSSYNMSGKIFKADSVVTTLK